MKCVFAIGFLLITCAAAQSTEDTPMYRDATKYLLANLKDPDSAQVRAAAWTTTKDGRNLYIEYGAKSSLGGYEVGVLAYPAKRNRFYFYDPSYNPKKWAHCDRKMDKQELTCTDVTDAMKTVFKELHTAQ